MVNGQISLNIHTWNLYVINFVYLATNILLSKCEQ
jgi:hypothetical protein